MSLKIFITIDTEEDLWSEYRRGNNSVENVNGIPPLQEIFDRYGATATYLVNYPIATDDKAVRILTAIHAGGRCEIGTHCHPWNTPPYEEEVNTHNTMMCNLPQDLIMRKLEVLHKTITNKFQLTPQSFRAGRWGISREVARCIRSLGYRVDSSVSPFVDWTGAGGPDFRNAPNHAYRFAPEDVILEKPDGPLLEVPPTIGFFQRNFKFCNALRTILSNPPFNKLHLIGILERLKILNFRWLSPELSSGADMIRLSKTFIRKGYRYLNMSFHSTSLLPGKSPFVDSNQRLKAFFKDIAVFLEFAAERGADFLPLSQSYESLPA